MRQYKKKKVGANYVSWCEHLSQLCHQITTNNSLLGLQIDNYMPTYYTLHGSPTY